jgi:hypothetical protein
MSDDQTSRATSQTPDAGREALEKAAVADQIIGQIEERFPNWQSFRDLIDCIDVTLHQLCSTPSASAMEDKEQFLFKAAEDAYFKAGRTSDPQDWLEAALLAQQHRNALNAARANKGKTS